MADYKQWTDAQSSACAAARQSSAAKGSSPTEREIRAAARLTPEELLYITREKRDARIEGIPVLFSSGQAAPFVPPTIDGPSVGHNEEKASSAGPTLTLEEADSLIASLRTGALARLLRDRKKNTMHQPKAENNS